MVARTRVDRGRAIGGPSSPLGLDYKPVGLWYQVDGDWERWCKSEGLEGWLDGKTYEVNVSKVNMLYISGVPEIDEFHRSFAEDWILPNGYRMARRLINWRRVGEQYDGVEIAPYLWERRLNWDGSHLTRAADWYYGWDCASGVVWNTQNVTLRLLKEKS